MNIQQWLDSGRDYETGRQLYEQFGPNKSLKKTFGRGGNKWNRDKLAYELGKLRDKQGHVVPGGDAEPVVLAGPIPEVNERMSDGVNEGNSPESVAVDSLMDKGRINEMIHDLPLDAPEVIVDMEKEWRAKYKRAATLQQQLHQAPTDAERAALCAEIVSIFEYEIDPIWEKLDEYKRTGKLPVEQKKTLLDKAKEFINGKKPYAEMNPVELMKERGNLRSNISKHKNNAKRTDDVEKWRKEQAEVEALLNPETPKGE